MVCTANRRLHTTLSNIVSTSEQTMKKKQRNRVYELSWFDGRCPHCIQCDNRKRRRLPTTLEALPWVSQVRVVAVRR